MKYCSEDIESKTFQSWPIMLHCFFCKTHTHTHIYIYYELDSQLQILSKETKKQNAAKLLIKPDTPHKVTKTKQLIMRH